MTLDALFLVVMLPSSLELYISMHLTACQSLLKQHGMFVSMSRKGSCWEHQFPGGAILQQPETGMNR